MSTTTARPRQTTIAGGVVMLGSFFMVVSTWDKVTRLRSLESREQIGKLLDTTLGRRSGLSVESAIESMHVIAIVAALCGVVAVALGWQALQRSTGARIGLSVLALPLLVSGLVVGAFMATFVAAATVALWVSPSREWFAGQPIPEPAKRPRQGMEVWEQTPKPTGDGTPELPGSSATPTGWSVSANPPGQRPQALTIAVVLMVLVATVAFVAALTSVSLLISQPEVLLDEVRRQNPDLAASEVTDSLLISTSYVSGALVMLWAALTMILAVLTIRRRAGAARGLVVCAIVCAAFSLFAFYVSPGALIPATAAFVSISCLRRPDVRAWLSGP